MNQYQDCREKRRLIRIDPDLGKVYDRIIAEKYGVSRHVVSTERVKAGIKAKGGTPPRKDSSPVFNMVAENRKLLGVYSDRSISIALGVNHRTVSRVRNYLKIPPGKITLKTHTFADRKRQLLEKWPCIPERVGKSRNEWYKYLEGRR